MGSAWKVGCRAPGWGALGTPPDAALAVGTGRVCGLRPPCAGIELSCSQIKYGAGGGGPWLSCLLPLPPCSWGEGQIPGRQLFRVTNRSGFQPESHAHVLPESDRVAAPALCLCGSGQGCSEDGSQALLDRTGVQLLSSSTELGDPLAWASQGSWGRRAAVATAGCHPVGCGECQRRETSTDGNPPLGEGQEGAWTLAPALLSQDRPGPLRPGWGCRSPEQGSRRAHLRPQWAQSRAEAAVCTHAHMPTHVLCRGWGAGREEDPRVPPSSSTACWAPGLRCRVDTEGGVWGAGGVTVLLGRDLGAGAEHQVREARPALCGAPHPTRRLQLAGSAQALGCSAGRARGDGLSSQMPRKTGLRSASAVTQAPRFTSRCESQRLAPFPGPVTFGRARPRGSVSDKIGGRASPSLWARRFRLCYLRVSVPECRARSQ